MNPPARFIRLTGLQKFFELSHHLGPGNTYWDPRFETYPEPHVRNGNAGRWITASLKGDLYATTTGLKTGALFKEGTHLRLRSRSVAQAVEQIPPGAEVLPGDWEDYLVIRDADEVAEERRDTPEQARWMF